MSNDTPLIVVLGATACGKSKLAIELAQRFKGEIISADSMQVYSGLDIVTNKVTQEEQRLAKHHMIDFLDPNQRYSVVDFRDKALKIIEKLREKGTVPIVVGGTNYYIESIMWQSFIAEPVGASLKRRRAESPELDEEDRNAQTTTLFDSEEELLKNLPQESIHTEDDLEDLNRFFSKPIFHNSFAGITSQCLWSILEESDQEAAHLIHPSDKRKIIRYLQIIQDRRTKYTDVLKNMNKSDTGDEKILGGPLRNPKTCVLWLSCANKVLDQVLDDRVDQMLDKGLLSELEQFHENYNRERLQKNEAADYTKGIFQTIGFKEFHKFLILKPEEKETEEGNELLKICIQEMKSSTRRYARKQFRWINNRLLTPTSNRDLPPVYKLETSFEDEVWNEQVRKPAFEIVSSLIENRTLAPNMASLRQKHIGPVKMNKPGKHYCEACDRTFYGTLHINEHLKSRKHQRRVASLKKSRLEVDKAVD